MNLSWMVYATCVSSLLAFAAHVLERPVRERERNTRVIWAAMLATALIWPAFVVFGRSAVSGTEPQANAVMQDSPANATARRVASAPILIPPLTMPAVMPASHGAEGAARTVALITPLLVLAVLLLELIRIARARRRWKPAEIDGIPVLLSADFGPAIIGVVKPQIVLPAWALELPPEQQRVMLAHESEHLASHDSRWLSVAFLSVVIAPWNLGMWWLLRRFRLAMEVDCDRRVLSRGHDLEQYGHLLLEIGRHGTGRSLLAAGFAERRTMLRARIDRMTVVSDASSVRHASRVTVGATLLLGACMLGPSPQRQSTGTKVTDHVTAATSIVVDTGAALRHIQAAFDRFPPPTTGLPSVATRFVHDTVRVNDNVELMTVAWIPKALLDSLHRPPTLRSPRLVGLSTARPLQGRTRIVRGRVYQMFVSWQVLSPVADGRIEIPPAVLTYQVPGWAFFAEEVRKTVQSPPAVLIVRR